MNGDWRNAFGSLICAEKCDGAGASVCDGRPSTCSRRICEQHQNQNEVSTDSTS